MDEYSKMALFNPYLQMALGILSGNTGRTKSEAFANAMGGGLSATQQASEIMNRQALTEMNRQRAAREQSAYEAEQAQEAAVSQWAMDMMQKDPANAEYYKLMMSNPKFGLTWFKTAMDAQNDRARTDAYIKAASMRGGGGGAFNWTPRDMSESDYKNIDAQMSTAYGEQWDNLDAQQKRAIAMDVYQQMFYDAKRGMAPGSSGVGIQLPEPRPSGWEKTFKKMGDAVMGFFGDKGEATDGWSVRKK